MTKVVHCKKEKFDVYIGRSSREKYHYGNPFAIGKDGDRQEVVRKYYAWISRAENQQLESERREWIRNNLQALKDKTLGCFCAPLLCHGDVLAGLVDGALQMLIKR